MSTKIPEITVDGVNLPEEVMYAILCGGLGLFARKHHGKSDALKFIGRQFMVKPDIRTFIYDPCYDKETEVLTNNGWKYFKDLLDNDLVATLNLKTNELEYQPIIRKIKHKVKEIYKYGEDKKRCFNFGVAKSHNMLVIPFYNSKNRNIEQKKIENLTNYSYYIPQTAIWKGKSNPYPNGYLKWFGLWLAEGCRTKYSVNIDMRKKHKPFLIELYDKLFFNYKIYDYDHKSKSGKITEMTRFSIHDVNFSQTFEKFGHAGDKFIPREILELDKESLMELFEGMMIGDGSYKYHSYDTSSKQLADDVQELLLKIGEVGNINPQPDKRLKFNLMYNINILKRKKRLILTKDIRIENYNDYVYCVEVQNSTLFVRRFGNPMFCGNCQNFRHFFDTMPYLEMNDLVSALPETKNIIYDVELDDEKDRLYAIGQMVLQDFHLKRELKKINMGNLPYWTLFIVEEAQDILSSSSTKTKIGKFWKMAVSEGRNFTQSFIITGQRMADIDTAVVERCNNILVGPLNGDNDYQKLKRVTNDIVVQTVKSLKRGQWVFWNGDKHEALRIDFPKFTQIGKPYPLIQNKGGFSIRKLHIP